VRGEPDDHGVHRLRRLLRVARGLARAARAIRRHTRGLTATSRRAPALALFVALVSACTSTTSVGPSASAAPTRTPDIQRSKLDIVYSSFVDMDVHNVSSKKALEGGLDAVREAARKLGSKADIATPDFQDVKEPVLADFRKFADAVSQIAVKAPDLQPSEIFRSATMGMIRQSPDCHTYYFDGRGRIDSRPVSQSGSGSVTPPQGQVLLQPDEAGLQERMLDGGVAWIRFTEFRITGTYDIRAKVKNALDVGLAAGAKAWLFDVRGNIGGNGPDVIASYFLNGESVMNVEVRSGKAGVQSANKDLRLAEKYQLPIAIVQNDAGGSGPEILALYMKETKRGTIVGGKSIGCVGSAGPTTLSDGTQIYVAVEEYSGATTGTKYNNIGVAPDVGATDAQAIDTAAKILRDKIAGK
jgi:hypothetical protein